VSVNKDIVELLCLTNIMFDKHNSRELRLYLLVSGSDGIKRKSGKAS
jgi:hypothetical protein